MTGKGDSLEMEWVSSGTSAGMHALENDGAVSCTAQESGGEGGGGGGGNVTVSLHNGVQRTHDVTRDRHADMNHARRHVVRVRERALRQANRQTVTRRNACVRGTMRLRRQNGICSVRKVGHGVVLPLRGAGRGRVSISLDCFHI